jgi:hypothetical protein
LAGGSGEELQQTAPSVGGVDLLAKGIGAVAEAFEIAVLQFDPCGPSPSGMKRTSTSVTLMLAMAYGKQKLTLLSIRAEHFRVHGQAV